MGFQRLRWGFPYWMTSIPGVQLRHWGRSAFVVGTGHGGSVDDNHIHGVILTDVNLFSVQDFPKLPTLDAYSAVGTTSTSQLVIQIL